MGNGLKKGNTRNRDELGENCPNQSGGLISGAGRSDGVDEREEAQVSLKEEPYSLRIYLKSI